jgi:hypothetical protein
MMKYSDDVDYLVAAIMYLGSSKFWWGRTPQRMASALNLKEERLKTVLESYRGLFRESRTLQDNGQYSFSLHARYAQFDSKDGSEATSDDSIPPVGLETVKLLLDFVQKMVDNEKADDRSKLTSKIPIQAAVISAVAAVVVGGISIIKDLKPASPPTPPPAAQSAK